MFRKTRNVVVLSSLVLVFFVHAQFVCVLSSVLIPIGIVVPFLVVPFRMLIVLIGRVVVGNVVGAYGCFPTHYRLSASIL